jgi:hypothetical protein
MYAGLVSLALLWGAAAPTSARAAPPASWTILVYINGVNDLEPYSLTSFQQMAKIGSTQDVNIVTEFGRLGTYNSAPNSPQWSGVLRFKITKGLVPGPTTAIANLGTADMGSPQTLADFLAWGTATFPASHYMLVIWNHGQGYRAYAMSGASAFSSSPSQSPFRSISTDDLHHSKLYMRDVEDVLAGVVASGALAGRKFDIVGFDACLMAMVENSYALRSVSKYMVASEELEPGLGWRYDDWLGQLTANPSQDGLALGKQLIDSYRRTYGDNTVPGADPNTTMSLSDLSKDGDAAGDLAGSVSSFAQALITALPSELDIVKSARAACPEYAPNSFGDGRNYFLHIDLGCFAQNVASKTKNQTTKRAAEQVLQAISSEIDADYVGAARQSFGSTGLAIYFPSTGAAYTADPYAEAGYEKNNTNHPVEFVQNELWTDFLHAYWQRVP